MSRSDKNVYSGPLRHDHRMKAAFITFALFCVSCATPRREAERRLRNELASPNEPGSVYFQAQIGGVDYRKMLRSAIARDEASLRRLFRFTQAGGLMGEGAETNCAVLYHLLHSWGDADYARILAAESPKVRAAVISEIDYCWPHPGWQADQFPKTYRLGEHPVRHPKARR